MAKNSSYFVGNGSEYNTDILNILYNGEIRRYFNDISTLDLATMNIKRKEATEVLREFNKDKKLRGDFIDVAISNKELSSDKKYKKIKIYPTIFDFDDEKTKRTMDYLRYFAEQRDYKFNHNENVVLDQNQEFYNFIDFIMPRLTGKTKSYICGDNSMLSKEAKETINKGFYGVDYARSYQLRNICASYTQLRLLVFEYLLILENENPLLKQFYRRFENAEFTGMELVPPVVPVAEEEPKEEKQEEQPKEPTILPAGSYTQMDLSSFIQDPQLLYDLRKAAKTKKYTRTGH